MSTFRLREVAVRNERTHTVIAGHVRVADHMVARLRGLLGCAEPARGEGLWLTPCSGIHTIGMRYAIDVAFLDRDGRVVRCYQALSPGRMLPWVRGAHSALELRSGALAATDTHSGDALTLHPLVMWRRPDE